MADKKKFLTPENYQKYFLPALGVLETIVTKGQSPGTSAMQQMQIFETYKDKAEEEKRNALARQLQQQQLELAGYNLSEAKRKKASSEQLEARKKALQERLGLAETDEDRQQAISGDLPG
jgi:hypothetical protein